MCSLPWIIFLSMSFFPCSISFIVISFMVISLEWKFFTWLSRCENLRTEKLSRYLKSQPKTTLTFCPHLNKTPHSAILLSLHEIFAEPKSCLSNIRPFIYSINMNLINRPIIITIGDFKMKIHVLPYFTAWGQNFCSQKLLRSLRSEVINQNHQVVTFFACSSLLVRIEND